MKQLKHWQDAVNVAFGIWLMLSSWMLGLSAELVPTANAVIVGMALVAAALGAILVPRAWEEWSEAALGLWLIVSPWALGFSQSRDARTVATATGIVIAALALWTLATDEDYNPWLRLRRDRAGQH